MSWGMAVDDGCEVGADADAMRMLMMMLVVLWRWTMPQIVATPPSASSFTAKAPPASSSTSSSHQYQPHTRHLQPCLMSSLATVHVDHWMDHFAKWDHASVALRKTPGPSNAPPPEAAPRLPVLSTRAHGFRARRPRTSRARRRRCLGRSVGSGGIYTYVRMYVCTYVYMYVRMYVCMYVCIYVCVYVCMYVCMCVCMYVCMCVCM